MTGDWDNTSYRRGYMAAEEDIWEMGITWAKETAESFVPTANLPLSDYSHGYRTCVAVYVERQMTQ